MSKKPGALHDAFEARYRFSSTDAAANRLDADGDGYTNVEDYLNGTSPARSRGRKK